MDVLLEEKLLQALETMSKLEIALVKPPVQLALEGWPTDSIKKLGTLTVPELLEMLQAGTIYDEIVGEETAERIATQVEETLNMIKQLPKASTESIQNRLSEILKVTMEERREKDEQGDVE